MRQNWLRKVVLRENDVVFQKQNRVQTYLSFSSFFFEIFTLAIPVDTKKKQTNKKKPSSNVFSRYSDVSNITKTALRSHGFGEVAKRGINEKWALLFKL